MVMTCATKSLLGYVHESTNNSCDVMARIQPEVTRGTEVRGSRMYLREPHLFQNTWITISGEQFQESKQYRAEAKNKF